MSAREETLKLRLELLKLRATMERTELRAAMLDLRASTQGVRRIAALAGGLGAGGGKLGSIVALLSQQPWLAALALRAWRAVRHHPLAGAALVAAAAAALAWQRSSRAEPQPAAPSARTGPDTEPPARSANKP